jgi:hypothetical protein
MRPSEDKETRKEPTLPTELLVYFPLLLVTVYRWPLKSLFPSHSKVSPIARPS